MVFTKHRQLISSCHSANLACYITLLFNISHHLNFPSLTLVHILIKHYPYANQHYYAKLKASSSIRTALSHSCAANLPTQLTSLPLRIVVGPNLLRPLRLKFWVLSYYCILHTELYLYFEFTN